LGDGGQNWTIHPSGVKSVLTRTGDVAADLEGEFTSYGRNMESASRSAGTLTMGGKAPEAGLVGAALAEFAARTSDDLGAIAARVGKSVQGAADATNEYIRGDLEMAADPRRTPK
jgi:Family of unknown function (DUF6507)